MKIFIEGLLPRIVRYSKKLDQLSLLVDEPWVLENEINSYKKLIFRKDNSIVVSENGNVSIGKWELLDKANSILLEINSTTRLYNHCFVDEGVIILKIDGGIDYLILVNLNIVPDLDLDKYFKNKISIGLRNQVGESGVSKDLVITYLTIQDRPMKGDLVHLNGALAPNGKYKLDSLYYMHVVNGRITKTSMF